MQFPDKPCHDTIHCVNWDFCHRCAPEFTDQVKLYYTRKGRQSSAAYAEAVSEVKAEIVEVHHQADEFNEDFQNSLHELAARCSQCGQLLPKEP